MDAQLPLDAPERRAVAVPPFLPSDDEPESKGAKPRLTPTPEPDFDWSPENPDIMMPEQRSTAVYLNRWQQVCIRQERAWDEDEDPYLCISVEHVPSLIDRLQALMREASRP
jgi:hypothetical protein